MRRSKNIEVRGCCMGIPVGCSSVLMLIIGFTVWQNPLSGLSLMNALLVVGSVLVVALATLLTMGWYAEKRERQQSG